LESLLIVDTPKCYGVCETKHYLRMNAIPERADIERSLERKFKTPR
jgi:hypothetical protein